MSTLPKNQNARPGNPGTGCSGEQTTRSASARPLQDAITLSEAQRIAESIVGPVRWNGAQGQCQCPGEANHTTATAPTDCKAVVEPIGTAGGTLAPGVYCFHGSCKASCDDASHALRSALGKRQPGQPGSRTWQPRTAPDPRPQFCAAKLERIARKLDGVDPEWLAARSAKTPWNRTPASFLHELYAPDERVVVFDVFESQGQALWTCTAPPFDARALDGFRTGKPQGVWFLCNPVSGTKAINDQGNLSRRSWQNVTAWRYLVLESDKANPEHWLAALVQMPLPIAAVYTSGGRSIHALVRIDAENKSAWDDLAAKIKPTLVTLGADEKAISAVRLTRLPCCERVEKGTMQRLLYLNGTPDEMPICELPPIAEGSPEGRKPADQDGGLL